MLLACSYATSNAIQLKPPRVVYTNTVISATVIRQCKHEVNSAHYSLFLLKTSFLSMFWSQNMSKHPRTNRPRSHELLSPYWKGLSCLKPDMVRDIGLLVVPQSASYCFLAGDIFSFQSCQTGSFHQHN